MKLWESCLKYKCVISVKRVFLSQISFVAVDFFLIQNALDVIMIVINVANLLQIYALLQGWVLTSLKS